MANQEFARPATVAFSEFTATLLRETLDAIIEAQLDQEAKMRQLLEISELDIEQFPEEIIHPEEVEIELMRLFPSAETDHAVVPGSPYRVDPKTGEETPPIFHLIGYRMQRGDLEPEDERAAITERGTKHITKHLHIQMAAEQRTNLLQLLRRGIPRVFVDHGLINAKLIFEMVQTESEEGTTPGQARINVPRPRRLAQMARPELPFRLQVKTLDLRRPEESRLTVNIAGEVQITFKTITD